MVQLKNIKNLLKHLPEKDIPIGERLLAERNWEELRALIYSAIVRTERKVEKDKSLENKIDRMRDLRAEVDSYVSLMYINYEEY